jgi:hypothetical protein
MQKPSRSIAVRDEDRCLLDFLTVFLDRLGSQISMFSAPVTPEHID